jgi:two-component system sensor histidine kinase KdpD
MAPKVLAGDGLAIANTAQLQALGSTSVRLRQRLIPYVWGALTALLSTEIALTASRYLQLADIIMLHLIGVVLIATRFDLRVSIFTAILSVLAFDYVFVPPAFVFNMPDVKSAITCAGMLVVAVVISGLTTRAGRFELAARSREAKTSLLYELGRELAGTLDTRSLLDVTTRHCERLLGQRVAVLVPDEKSGALNLGDVLAPAWLSQAELDHAQAIWEGAAGSPSLVRSSGAPVTHFFFLTGAGSPFGLLVVRGPTELFSDASEREFFEVCAHQAAIALERADLAEKAAAAELAAKREHVHNALLRSISHDFRTPLAAIVGAGMSLLDYDAELEPDARRSLEHIIVEQGRRLNRLLTNVLSATRLEHGELTLERSACAIEEIVEGAFQHLGDVVNQRRFDVKLPLEVPLIDVDAGLVEQLVVNVVENALRYSPSGAPIEIGAVVEGEFVRFSVSDRGPGLAPGDDRRIFEKFYRGAAATSTDGGMGLGLTICQAIVHAHGGTISARNREGGGLTVTATLPSAAEREIPVAFRTTRRAEEPC